MKKCSSCTKDLPDAALHCVFCGAKQAPANQQPLAKTVMGYSQADMIEQLKAQGKPVPPQLQQMDQNRSLPPAGLPPKPPAGFPPPAHAPPAQVPTSGAQAKTLFASGPPPGAFAGLSNQGPMPTALGVGNASPAAPPTPPSFAPPPPAPAFPPAASSFVPTPGPLPSSNPNPYANAPANPYAPVPQYLASNTAAQAGRPIEPLKDGLKLMMIIWGGVLLLAFLLPIQTGRLMFSWDVIMDAPGRAKVMPLLIGASGLLALVFAFLPLATVARGVLAMVLGLAGVVAPLFLGHDVPGWQTFAFTGGMIALLPGLLLRDDYRDSILPRLLATFGAAAVLAVFLVPQHGELPIVNIFKNVIDAPGEMKVVFGLELGFLILIILSFLVWLPSPGSGGAKINMWILASWPALMFVLGLALTGRFGMIPDSPQAALGFAVGMDPQAEVLALGLPMAFALLLAYGGAATLGKSLEQT